MSLAALLFNRSNSFDLWTQTNIDDIFYFCLDFRKNSVTVMDNTEGIVLVINDRLSVAKFLLDTRQDIKVIELCKECLILLESKAFENNQDLGDFLYECIHDFMFEAYRHIQDYTSVIEGCRNLLVIHRENGSRIKEGLTSIRMAGMYTHKGNFKEAKCLYKEALSIMKEIGDRHGEACSYAGLGTALLHLGEFQKAEEYLEKAITIRKEIGDREGEAEDYGSLGSVFQSIGEYAKAKEYIQKALGIRKEVGDRRGEAGDYDNLGSVFTYLCEYGKAHKCIQKSLEIAREIDDRYIVSSCYTQLGHVFAALSQYGKAEQYYQQALAIAKKTGNRHLEAVQYGSLGAMLQSLGEYVKARENHMKALALQKEIGDKDQEALCNGNLGTTFLQLAKYDKAKEHLERALVIRKETGDRRGEAACYGNLGSLSLALDDLAKAEEYLQEALVIRKEIGDKRGEAADYGNLGTVFRFRGEYIKAREYHMKALSIGKEIGTINAEFSFNIPLTLDMLMEGNIQDATSSLLESIAKSEKMRSYLSNSDQFKISFLHEHAFPYHMLSSLFCFGGHATEALYVVELGRARALADLMSTQYSIENQTLCDPLSLIGIEWIMKNELNSSCLYISFFNEFLFLWIFKGEKSVVLKQIDINDAFINKGATVTRMVDEVFGNETVRGFHTSLLEDCEDRSLFPPNNCHQTGKPSQEGFEAANSLRLVEIEEEDDDKPDPSLSQCYQMLISPVADLLDEPEIIIVPDRALYKVPFAALSDENGIPLSETFRIRIVPSLTTLKLIQDCPEDYHSQTGALIVGEPEVSEVSYKGNAKTLCPLPFARKEAEMIGRLLGTQPLLGQQATKQAVLQSIHSVALIHFAAHGSAERGEIALSPLPSISGIPQEEDYLLTMADIARVRLRAKLVVLSCCHSARGQIMSEGVVGIARAFLGSGARSVLVALWAIDDKATEQFMGRFYEHLVRGESASESLHQAMKWMRRNGFTEMDQWAPFMLIGDNVTFDFGK